MYIVVLIVDMWVSDLVDDYISPSFSTAFFDDGLVTHAPLLVGFAPARFFQIFSCLHPLFGAHSFNEILKITSLKRIFTCNRVVDPISKYVNDNVINTNVSIALLSCSMRIDPKDMWYSMLHTNCEKEVVPDGNSNQNQFKISNCENFNCRNY